MIDRASRHELSVLLRRLAIGRITNDRYEDSIPWSPDRSIGEIHGRGAWYLYSDLRSYRLAGPDRLDRPARREVARWILFLNTDLEYEWPVMPAPIFVAWFLLSVLTAGLAGRLVRALLSSGGDVKVWPFRSRNQLEEALRRSPFSTAGT